jgi:lysophospholipase L1-like esterase
VLVIQGGINDIAQSLAGAEIDRFEAVAEAARNLREMVRRGKRLGLEVEIADVLPWNNAHPYATPHIDRLNEEIAQIGEQEGVPILPFHEVLEDQFNRGLMRAEWTADGDHPSIEGYRRLGELAFRLPPR